MLAVDAMGFSFGWSRVPRRFFCFPDGSESNDGSIGAAFATIGRAVAEVQPGDTIFLRGGQQAKFQAITEAM